MTAVTMRREARLWDVDAREPSCMRRSGRPCTGSSSRIQIPDSRAPPRSSVRPAIAIIPFVGLRLRAGSPVFFTGAVGNAIVDQIMGYGFLTSWNWSIANGLVGLLAGLAPLYFASMAAKNRTNRAIVGAIAGAAPSSSDSCSWSRTCSWTRWTSTPSCLRLTSWRSSPTASRRSSSCRPARRLEPVKARLAASASRSATEKVSPRYLGGDSFLGRRDPRVLILVPQ